MPHLSFQRFKKVHMGKASGFPQFSYQKPNDMECKFFFLHSLNNLSFPNIVQFQVQEFFISLQRGSVHSRTHKGCDYCKEPAPRVE